MPSIVGSQCEGRIWINNNSLRSVSVWLLVQARPQDEFYGIRKNATNEGLWLLSTCYNR